MNSFKVEGGVRLSGEVFPQGAKNEALQVICSVILTEKEVIIDNIPEILDVIRLIDLLEYIGVKVNKLRKSKYSFKADSIDLGKLQTNQFNEKARGLRGSIMIIGPMLSRFGKASIPKPGGDKIGRRLGYRTANVFLNDCILPLRGVYVTRLYNNKMIYNGISNYGVAPTFGRKKTDVLETHLFVPIKNLYKKNITIEFLKFLRKEKKFKSKKNLLDQIKKDITGAKKVLKNAR